MVLAGDYNRLVIGEPFLRAKLPRSDVVGPCEDETVTGSNVLDDAGFEDMAAELSASAGDPIPFWDNDDGTGENGIDPPTTIHGWMQYPHPAGSAVFPTDSWQLATSDPRTGTYHATVSYDVAGTSRPPGLAVASYNCDATTWFIPCDGASEVDLSFWFKAVVTGTLATGTFQVYTAAYSDRDNNSELVDGRSDVLDDETHTLADPTSSYAEYTVNWALPSDAKYLEVVILPPAKVTTSSIVCSIDDCSVVLS